jgi:opacity protein-like surface antigen
MWRMLATLILGLAVSGAAAAGQTVDAPPQLDWTGVYLGTFGSYSLGTADGYAGCCKDGFTINGIQAGGLAGYNFELMNTITGLEADAGFFDVDGLGFGHGVDDFDVTPVVHLRGRVGIPVDDILLFLAAGISLGQGNARVPRVGSAAEWHLGWNAGAGVDVAFGDHIVMRAEYVYDSMFEKTYRYSQGDMDFDWAASTLRAAAIFKF